MTMSSYIISTDGGARGNPGPAAIGFVIDGSGLARIERGECIGNTTNNVAEYTAAIRALTVLRETIGDDAATGAAVQVRADSELLVKQVRGVYRVKDGNLKGLYAQLIRQMSAFREVTFMHIRREQNKDADRMVNHALDTAACG